MYLTLQDVDLRKDAYEDDVSELDDCHSNHDAYTTKVK